MSGRDQAAFVMAVVEEIVEEIGWRLECWGKRLVRWAKKERR